MDSPSSPLSLRTSDDDHGDDSIYLPSPFSPPPSPSRALCSTSPGCGRPASVCLCPSLPLTPLPISTTIIILHHPHALRRNPLSTLPILSRCLSNLHLLPGRRFLSSSTPLLPSPNPTLFLFPSPSAADITAWAHSVPPRSRANPVLVLVDGTWKQAKEMAAASAPFLSSFVVPVSLPCEAGVDGESIYESGLVLKKEPVKGCMSTLEAVARALRVLEPEGKGVQIEELLVRVLEKMVGFQREHLKPMKTRVRMRKKKELKSKDELFV